MLTSLTLVYVYLVFGRTDRWGIISSHTCVLPKDKHMTQFSPVDLAYPVLPTIRRVRHSVDGNSRSISTCGETIWLPVISCLVEPVLLDRLIGIQQDLRAGSSEKNNPSSSRGSCRWRGK